MNTRYVDIKPGEIVQVRSMRKSIPPLPDRLWQLLARCEKPLYDNQFGAHSYTECMSNDGDDALLTSMWDQAFIAAEGASEVPGHRDSVEAETARRVAAAIAILTFGKEFLLK